jgi:hypothetical protein
MTAQMSDRFIFRGEEYVLVGTSGGELFSPQQYGMEPEMIHTACYRGFYATYELTDDALYLRSLTIRERRGRYVPLGGVVPDRDQSRATYDGLSVVVPFTGTLRLAKDFIEELYIHMGFQKPSAFETVIDVGLKAGRVVSFEDRSAEMAEERGAFKARYDASGMIERIEDAFSLDLGEE